VCMYVCMYVMYVFKLPSCQTVYRFLPKTQTGKLKSFLVAAGRCQW